MTVCVSVKVNDCMVFAADSALTMSGTGGNITNVYNSGDKVFNLHRNCAVGAMFCGMGDIGQRSISNLAKEFRHGLMKGTEKIDPEDYTMESIAQRANDFFRAKYAAVASGQAHNMEFFIGGFSSVAQHGELWKLGIEQGQPFDPILLRGEGDHGLNWAGQTSPISRLLLGVDPGLAVALTGRGVTREAANAIFTMGREALQTPLLSDPMPTGDAIRLAEFLVDVTKGYFSFVDGADIVGGESDVSAITKWEGFKWVKRKHFYPASLNGATNGHVC